jgi:hypothetical protein
LGDASLQKERGREKEIDRERGRDTTCKFNSIPLNQISN